MNTVTINMDGLGALIAKCTAQSAKKTLNFDEACEYLKISHTSMIDLIATGELPAAKISKCYVFREESLAAYLTEQERIQTEARREAYRSGITQKVKTAVAEVRKGRRRVLPPLPPLPGESP
ncbi:MAG: helix-turn-helix domain-containing protein [Nitrosomonadales bacterium]|nr:helix-turn-helix domain-containing protein [Nitrosomonadales bacterium]